MVQRIEILKSKSVRPHPASKKNSAFLPSSKARFEKVIGQPGGEVRWGGQRKKREIQLSNGAK